jgi:flagellar hook assembly protein FlgD
MLGELVRTIVDEHQTEGYYERVWDGRNEDGSVVGTGVYLCRLTAGSFASVSKVLMVK